MPECFTINADEIENRTQEEAQNFFEFIELLLIANYEFADEGGENGKKS